MCTPVQARENHAVLAPSFADLEALFITIA